MPDTKPRFLARTILPYVAFAALWMYLSDRILAAIVTDPALLTRLQTYNGLAFILVTAFLLYWLLRRELGQREHAENEQQRLSARIHEIPESITDGFVALDKNGRYLYVNRRAAGMFGRKPGELIGRHFWTEFPEGVNQPFYKACHQAMAEQVPSTIEDYYAPWDRWFEHRIFPSTDALYIFFQDITERKRTESELRASETRLRATSGTEPGARHSGGDRMEERFQRVVEAVPTGIVLVNAAGVITLVNAQIGKIFGYPGTTLIGQPIEVLVPERFRAAHPGQRGGYFANPQTRAMGAGRDLFGRRQDGREVPIEIGLSPMDTDEGRFVLASIVDISARKHAEAAVLRLQREHERILNTVDIGIHGIDRDGKIFFENLRASALFGRDAREMIGQPAHALMHHTRADGTPYPQHDCPIYATLHDGITRGIENEVFWRKDGTCFPVAYTSTPLYDDAGQIAGTLVAFSDISARQQMEEALRRAHTDLERRVRERTDELHAANQALQDSDQRMRLATEATGVGIWEWNVLTNKIWWDVQMFRNYGIAPTADGFVEYSDWSGSVLPEDLAEQEQILQDTVRRRGHSTREFRIRRRDNGELRVIQAVETVRTNAAGQAEWVVGTNLDISERRRAEVALRQAHDELEAKVVTRTAELNLAKERAEAADRIKSAFLATMSHELRTPLNSIIGFTGIVLQGLAGPLAPEQSKQLDMVRNSARHLLALINDVLDISRIEAGQLEVAQLPFDLRASIDKVIHLVTPLADKKGLALRLQITPDLGQGVSDERRFEQILINLLGNAIKFTDHGEVVLTAERISAFTTPAGAPVAHAVRLRVADTGPGIRPEDLATLFQPFRQLDSGLARNHEGTGLGLAICQRLAEMMGGEIHATSTFGQGSTFSFTLPLPGATP